MDKSKPEDDLIPDPSDHQYGRSRKQDTFDNEPKLNIDDIEIDADDRRVSKAKRAREDGAESESYAADEDIAADSRPLRRRKKTTREKSPISRQYLMMGTGILVLLLLIFGIASALKAPSPDAGRQHSGTEKNIDLSVAADNNSMALESPAVVSQPQDLSVPPIASTPTQASNTHQSEGQQRVELQGDLGNILTQQQDQIENVAARSTLPMEPATVVSAMGNKTVESRPERKTTVIEPGQKTSTRSQSIANTESKPASVRRTEQKPLAVAETKTTSAVQTPVVKAPVSQTPTKPPVAAKNALTQTNIQAIKNASPSSYTLQVNASSNSANLNAWAKKENLQNYVVYQTSRNGQPWYVMVSGIYATRAEAERAVSRLPAGVQSNKPWTKPIRQVQSEIK